MCGRYAILEEEDIMEMREIIQEANRKFSERQGLVLNGEIYPTNTVPVLKRQTDLVSLEVMKWGFPHFKDKGSVIINARSETVREKKMFREAFAGRRLILPATGFYEWDRKLPKGQNKFYMTLPGRVMYMAGIFSRLIGPDHLDLDCFVILTCASTGVVSAIHDRMPVILPKSAIRNWLSPQQDPASLLQQAIEPTQARLIN